MCSLNFIFALALAYKSWSYMRKSATIITCTSLVSFPLGLHYRFSHTIYKNSCVIARAKYSLKRNEKIKNVGDWGLSQKQKQKQKQQLRQGREGGKGTD